ncbi:MAG: glycine cleavage system aminomethyltransferase GcvT [Pseudomonadales bacterium]
MADTIEALKTTPLHDLHVELDAKMVPFAGHAMPVQYALGVMKEHLHTREKAGLFDVSHMGQVIVSGPNVIAELEAILPIDVEALAINKQSYAVFTDTDGGILDDLIVSRWADDTFFLVVNAACKAQDIAHLQQHLTSSTVTPIENQALLALQGPMARQLMTQLCPATAELVFMSGIHAQLAGSECYITCSGYTGEDGFEISVPDSAVTTLANTLLAFDEVEAIGLGARDSLRLEAGLCLYGHDMDTTTSPVDASLVWSISKSRRADGTKAGNFPGSDTILAQLAIGADRKRVGLKALGRAPVREGAELTDSDGNIIGKVTSGGFSPCLQSPIAMGYVDKTYANFGTEVFALVRNKPVAVEICKMPFVTQNYFRG